MKTYEVVVPIVGTVTMTIQADSGSEAIGKVFDTSNVYDDITVRTEGETRFNWVLCGRYAEGNRAYLQD